MQFTVYEELKHFALRWGSPPLSTPTRDITSFEASLCAAASKLAASVITYPVQVIRWALLHTMLTDVLGVRIVCLNSGFGYNC